jgi:hypothetical protein
VTRQLNINFKKKAISRISSTSPGLLAVWMISDRMREKLQTIGREIRRDYEMGRFHKLGN